VQQTGRADRIGDFARDTMRTDCCRGALYSKAAVRVHLIGQHGACEARVRAGEAAWDDFYAGLVDQVIAAAERVLTLIRRRSA